jgi:drug/metabolite transporter (DMT)-like permease
MQASSKPATPEVADTKIPPNLEAPVYAQNRFGFTNADLFLFLCVSIWAVNVPLVKSILPYIDPLGIALIRFGTAGLIMIPVVLWKEKNLKVAWEDVPLILAGALVGIFLNQIFFVYALKNTTSSEVSLLMAASPTFAALFAWLFAKEKITRNYWLSLPVALFGVILIVLTAQGAQLGGSFLGNGLALLTAGSWACYTVIVRPLMYKYSTLKVSAYITFIGALMILPFGLPQINPEKLATAPFNIWLFLLYCTFASVLLTNLLWYLGIKRLGSQRTAFYAYLQPFLGVIAAFIILNEQVVGWQILGGCLVIFSMIIYRRRQKKV